MREVNDIKELEWEIVADIEKFVYSNRHMPDETGTATVDGDTQLASSSIVGFEAAEPYGKVVLPLTITYLQNQLDPTLTTQATAAPSESDLLMRTSRISRKFAVREGLKYNLAQITTGDGYENDLTVYDRVVSFSKIINYPAALIVESSDTVLNEDDTSIQDSQVHKRWRVDVNAYTKTVNRDVTVRETLVQDLEKMFINKWSLPDARGRRTCTALWPVENQSIGIQTTADNVIGVRFGVDVMYRQLLTDPTQPSTA